MQLRKLRTTVALLTATTGVAVFAASAQATVVDTDAMASLTHDPDGEVTLTSATTDWDYTSGKVKPHLTAKLNVVDGDDACFRATIKSYDSAGTVLHTDPGGNVCPTDDLAHTWSVDLNGTADALTRRATVSLEKETIIQPWTTKDTSSSLYPNFSADSFSILGSGIYLGGSGWSGTAPVGNALVTWQLDSTGNLLGYYTGTIHFNGFSHCGRVSLRYLNDANVILEQVDGPSNPGHCPNDLGHYQFTDSLVNAASPDVTKVKVILQDKIGGSWVDVGAQTLRMTP